MTTTTLFKIVKSEYIKRYNLNEFENGIPQTSLTNEFGQFVYFDSDYQFTTKFFNYDKETEKIVNDLFNGLKLKNDIHDIHFKKMFINNFANRQINRQTVESFKMQLTYTFMSLEKYINTLYTNLQDYIDNKTTNKNTNENNSKNSNDNTSITDTRNIFQDLPQDMVNMNLDKNDMTYATNNTIDKNRNVSNGTSTDTQNGKSESENFSYSFDNLVKSTLLFEKVMEQFDRKCFLQTW